MISKDSTSLFDEQQSVLNFMIHTADIAHNSKPFEISQDEDQDDSEQT